MENPINLLSQRLQYILDHYGQDLSRALVKRENFHMEPEECLDSFANADPSHNKSATQWLITTYLNNGFRFEDLSKAYETLQMFGLYRRKLDASSRSLNQYKTLADVYASIEAFIPKENEDLTLSGKALKRSEREKAHQETEFLHQDDKGLTLVSPKTEYASKWWGKGTQWCTASDNNNMFQCYNKEAPLLIFIMPNGDKLQLHIGEDVQFMDARDNEVSNQYVEDNWSVLETIMTYVVKQNGLALSRVSEKFRNRELCWLAIKQNGIALECVPKELRDRELCLEAVRQNGLAFLSVPEQNLRDLEICLEAVRQNGFALQYVTEQFRDKELCLEAVRQNGWVLDYVPDKLRDREMCLEATRQDGRALQFVPKEFRDRELCWEAVKQNVWALLHVPKELRDKEICLEAVKQDGRAMLWVPKEILDKEICMEAVRQNGLQYVPEQLVGKELCWSAVKLNGMALGNIPEKLINRELCLKAVRVNGMALQYVPKELRDRELCLKAVRKDGIALQWVPKELRDREICLEAVRQNGLEKNVEIKPDWNLDILIDLKTYLENSHGQPIEAFKNIS